ncbi:VOC family protein [Brevibacillus composti]|uniref:VOC family protein n=1 Tax=Brevibacillus composti TaxID=2796470 RepID=A0A7T5ELZ7_9BACL|nr:VOC family protein [Brevibacillus composti]QQE75071.1 VOC family protein [Brevibacillus composti]QUO42157.1 VOC family protein [Brevibacillus composti]
MFAGQAEEAMNFYLSVFDQSEIKQITYQENGSVLHATFALKGQSFMCIDNLTGHPHAYTPALSLFVQCDSEEEIDTVFDKLSQGGKMLMPLEPSPFSEKFGWVEDRYGVSWQVNLAKQ